MQKNILLGFFILTSISLFSQDWSGLIHFSGSNIRGGALDVDDNGNIISCGIFYQSLIHEDTSMFSGTNDVSGFLAKFDSTQNLLWAKQIEPFDVSSSYSDVAFDQDGNVVFAADASTLYEVSPGNLIGNPSVAKLDPDGNLLWYIEINGSTGNGTKLVADEEGNIYVIFSCSNSGLFGDLNVNSNAPGTEVAVGKINSDGVAQWVKVYSGNISFGAAGLDICYNENLGLFISGNFGYKVLGKQINTINGQTLQDYKSISTSSNIQPNMIAVTEDNNRILIGATFQQEVIIGIDTIDSENINDHFVASYDMDGNVNWVNYIYSTTSGISSGMDMEDMAGDSLGVYICGQIGLESSFGGDTVTCVENISYMVKFDENGEVIWVEKFGSDGGSFSANGCHAMVYKPDGYISAIGDFSQDGQFGPFYVPYDPTIFNDQVFILHRNGVNADTNVYNNLDQEVSNSIFNIYPNPSDGLVKIDISLINNVERVKIFNISGLMIRDIKVNSNEVIEVDIYEPSGVYFITIETSVNQITKKIIKM